jgi:hypothetical protein
VFPTGIDRRVDVDRRTASISITEWLTTELAWLASTSLMSCRSEKSLTHLLGPVINARFPRTQWHAAAFQKAGSLSGFFVLM